MFDGQFEQYDEDGGMDYECPYCGDSFCDGYCEDDDGDAEYDPYWDEE